MAPYTVPFIVNGEELIGKETFEVKSPASGQVVHLCGVATVSDADAAVDAAAAAASAWRDTTTSSRRDILLKAAELMTERRSELSQYLVDEIGQPQGWATFNLDVGIDLIKDAAGRIGASVEGSVPRPSDPSMGAMVWREPYGVVLAIAPWNAPYILGVRSVLYPIAAGCTVVLKGSEVSPRVMHAIASIFNDAGLPKGVLNLISTNRANAPAVTEALIAHPSVKKINFTGSTGVGRIVGKLAGQYLKPIVLELGGKAPAIVWEDANLDLAADECSLGAFLNSGQICMSTERIIVHKKISEAFQSKLRETVSKKWSGAQVHINAQAVEKNRRLAQDAANKGASILNGEINAEESLNTHLKPVVIAGVTPNMDIYKEESFGATVSLLEIESEEEALRIANDTEYGLSSAVFTEDLRTGLRFAKNIETGAVHINSMSVHDEAALPHGGAKASGYGRFNASVGLEEYLRTKVVTWKG
ncbi:Aldehyde/histidinol dehydrogenase [Xylaria bambusicola]|uniref:Aldehyde/histidinol dehydrogenase n=1 Tax=Xylaria bambusicola TaxID=326684 RepID=UPI002007FB86|nr:Aldehyde/histidinol dehydrogenase [Xylaria bambusicola]KAI0506954.1 Aldehyde/histidinol dehydrogenase [Xylaria bambusicola]